MVGIAYLSFWVAVSHCFGIDNTHNTKTRSGVSSTFPMPLRPLTLLSSPPPRPRPPPPPLPLPLLPLSPPHHPHAHHRGSAEDYGDAAQDRCRVLVTFLVLVRRYEELSFGELSLLCKRSGLRISWWITSMMSGPLVGWGSHQFQSAHDSGHGACH